MTGMRGTIQRAVRVGDWVTRAACRTMPSGWWELTSSGYGLSADNKAAINLCGNCPVRLDCGAATHPLDEGVIRAGYAIRNHNEAKAIAEAARKAGGVTPIWPDARRLPCGTYAAYRRHLAASEVACGPCRAAANSYQRNRWHDPHIPTDDEEA
jgi:hypothetical protein